MATDPTPAHEPLSVAHATDAVQAPPWLRDQVASLEQNQALDSIGDRIATATGTITGGRNGELLRGQWLGHALHPLLTDLPLGCWFSAGVLDLVGGRSSRRAAKRLIGVGLVLVPPTVASGLADWSEERDPKVRRVGVAHALGNGAVAALYFLSWRARRRGHHLRGKVLGLAGGGVAIGTGYLGGHMSFARRAGTGQRGMDLDTPVDATVVSNDVVASGTMQVTGTESPPLVTLTRASELLGVPIDQVRAMVDEDMLDVVDRHGGEPRFREDDVLALRLLGG